MNRRQVLKGVAAGSALGVGIGTASGRPSPSERTPDDLDAIRVVRGDEVVRTVESPTEEDLSRLWDELGGDERLRTTDDCEIVECCSDCYNCCLCGTYC